MKQLKILLAIMALFLSEFVVAQNDSTWTLEKCVKYALENNLDVQRSALSVQNEEALLKQDRLTRLPTFNGGLQNSWRWGRSIDPTTNVFTTDRINSNGVNASSSVTLYNGNRQVNSIRQSEKLVEAGHYDLEKSKNDVALNVAGAYLNVLFAQEQLVNAKTQLNTTKAQLDMTQKKVDAGALPITNLLDLEAQQSSNEVELINQQNSVDIALLQLKQYLQIPATESFQIVVPEIDITEYKLQAGSSEQVYQKALSTQPEIRSVDLNRESADLGVKIAKGARIPILSANGQYYTNYSSTQDYDGRRVPNGQKELITNQTIGYLASDPTQQVVAIPYEANGYDVKDGYTIPEQWADNRSWSLGFNLSIPIFNGYQISTAVQRAKIQQDLSKINAKETRNVLRQNVERAYTDARAAAKVLDAAEKQVGALEESFRATEKSYNLGAVNFVDYQVSSNNLFKAKSDLVRAKYDFIFKIKVLDFYLGNPITL